VVVVYEQAATGRANPPQRLSGPGESAGEAPQPASGRYFPSTSLGLDKRMNIVHGSTEKELAKMHMTTILQQLRASDISTFT
jgi:hypothetical protein